MFEIPNLYNDIKSYILSKILLNILLIQIQINLYEIKLCGGKIKINIDKNKLYIYLETFNYNIDKLVNLILKYILKSKIDKTLFEFAKTKYKLFMEENINDNLLFQLDTSLSKIFYKQHYENEVLNNINNIYYDDYLKSDKLFKNINNIKVLIYGNNFIINQKLYEILSHYNKYYSHKSNDNIWKLNKIINNQIYIYNVTNNNNILFNTSIIIKSNKNNKNEYFKYKIYNYIINKTLKYLFFNEFRTKQQLGYVVKNDIDTFGDIEILFVHNFYIQMVNNTGNINKLNKLKDDINLFFTNSYENIFDLSYEDFNNYKYNLIEKYKKKYINYYKSTKILFNNLIEECFNFDLNEKMINYINNTTLDDVCYYYKKYFIDEKIINYIIIKN
jgi:secreted Zn-dependent insulinase-like peptidase